MQRTRPLQFYRSLVRRVPGAFWAEADRADKVAYLLGLLVVVLVFFRPELAAIPMPRWWALPVLGFLLLYAVVRANYLQYADVEQQRDASRARVAELEERLTPRIVLEFDPSDDQCIFDASEQDAMIAGSGFRILRLRLRNASGSRLERVRVLVEGIGQLMPLGEQPLQFQRDLGEEVPREPGLPPLIQRRRRHPDSVRGYDLAPYERTYVNLLFKKEAGESSDQFDFHFANPIPSEIPAGQRQIALVAYADNAPPVRAVAGISLDDRGRPYCELETKLE